MLVISRNLVLSAAELALPPGTPLILWHNLVTFSNITANTAETDYPATNLANPATNSLWRAASDSPSPGNVLLTITTNHNLIDAVGIAEHNFGSAGIAVSIERYDGLDENTPAGEVWTELVQPQIPSDDAPLLFLFSLQSIERIRIKLVEGSDMPEAAVVYVGKALRSERGVVVTKDFTPPRFGRRTEVINGRSERGNYLGRVVLGQHIETTVDFAHFRPDWYREHFHPFVTAAQSNAPFFFAWAPSDYPYEVGYCWLTDDPMPVVSPVTGRFSTQLKMSGIVS